MLDWGHSVKERLHASPRPSIVPCGTCSSRVRSGQVSTCGRCAKAICVQCGTVLSFHLVHHMQDFAGRSRVTDEEVARTGTCAREHADDFVLNALASCLLDDFRARLKTSGLAVDRSVGRYGPNFQLALPGLPTDLVQRIQLYCGTDGAVRMPYRYVVDAHVHHPNLLQPQPDGSLRVLLDDLDDSQYLLVEGRPYVLDSVHQLTMDGAGSYRAVTWERTIHGVARLLDVSGRYEDAAKVLEIGGYFDEAGAERSKAPVSATVGQELAQLVAAFRSTGLVSVYRCPSCGASIRFSKDTSDARIRTCEYCGNSFQESDLAEFLRTIIGVTPQSSTRASQTP